MRGAADRRRGATRRSAGVRRTDARRGAEAIDVSGSHLERGAERRRLLRAIERDDGREDQSTEASGSIDASGSTEASGGADVNAVSDDQTALSEPVVGGDASSRLVTEPGDASDAAPASAVLPAALVREEPTEDGDA